MQEHTGFRTPCKKVSSVARKAVQKGQEAPYHRRSRTVLSGVQGVYRRHRAGDTPAKEQAEEEELLFGQEKKEAHSQEAGHGQQARPDTAPDLPCKGEETRLCSLQGQTSCYATAGRENVVDLGYKGADKDFPTVRYVLPIKKKRKRKLSEKEKRYNRRVARAREGVVVEHAIARTKKYGIMGTRFRNRLKRYDTASSIVVSGLVNFRIMRANGLAL